MGAAEGGRTLARGTGEDATAGSGIIGVAMGGNGTDSEESSSRRGSTKVGALTSSSGDAAIATFRPLETPGITAVGSRRAATGASLPGGTGALST
jgi:hypothetical protein